MDSDFFKRLLKDGYVFCARMKLTILQTILQLTFCFIDFPIQMVDLFSFLKILKQPILDA